MTTKEKLKHCPFCGSEASIIAAWQQEDGTYYPARCGCCKCGVGYWGESGYGHDGFATEEDFKKSAKQAVSKWNTRTSEPIVRCRDCDFYAKDGMGDCCTLYDFCSCGESGSIADGFCSWGERRKDG